MNSFLLSLPAILGIVGFVIYYILKKSVTEDPIVKSIIEKLKYDEPGFFKSLSEIPDAQKAKLLKSDYALRQKLSERDRDILDKALSNQFKTNIFVYALCAFLLVLGICLFIKPKPLFIDNIQIQNSDSTSRDMIVDIDPLTITWTSSGTDESIEVVVENIETGKQSKRYRALASDGRIVFAADNYDNYDKILSNRNPNESNRLRAIIYAGSESFKSKPYDVKVGVKVICYEKLPDEIVFNAIVDQRIIDNFRFAPRLALFKDEKFNGQKIFEARSYDSEPVIQIKNAHDYSIGNFVLNIQPEAMVNQRIYRTDIESLKSAILALKSAQ